MVDSMALSQHMSPTLSHASVQLSEVAPTTQLGASGGEKGIGTDGGIAGGGEDGGGSGGAGGHFSLVNPRHSPPCPSSQGVTSPSLRRL